MPSKHLIAKQAAVALILAAAGVTAATVKPEGMNPLYKASPHPLQITNNPLYQD